MKQQSGCSRSGREGGKDGAGGRGGGRGQQGAAASGQCGAGVGAGEGKAVGGGAEKSRFKGGRAGGLEMNGKDGWVETFRRFRWRVPELTPNTPGPGLGGLHGVMRTTLQAVACLCPAVTNDREGIIALEDPGAGARHQELQRLAAS